MGCPPLRPGACDGGNSHANRLKRETALSSDHGDTGDALTRWPLRGHRRAPTASRQRAPRRSLAREHRATPRVGFRALRLRASASRQGVKQPLGEIFSKQCSRESTSPRVSRERRAVPGSAAARPAAPSRAAGEWVLRQIQSDPARTSGRPRLSPRRGDARAA